MPNENIDIARRVSRRGVDAYLGMPLRTKLEHVQAEGMTIRATGSSRVLNYDLAVFDPLIVDVTAVDSALAQERLIGSDDMLSIAWLHMALRAARAVARVETQFPGQPEKFASGFMISPELFITNHHVLANQEQASDDSVQLGFGFQDGPDGNQQPGFEYATLDPGKLFITNEALDFAIVAVRSDLASDPVGKRFGWLTLRGAPCKALPGSPLNIIQHPDSQLKKIAMRNNLMTDIIADDLLVYLTDTNPGSSGSPVLDDKFQVIALHCRGREFEDEHGRKIDLNGEPVTEFTPESARYWVANEGTRISAIVGYLKEALGRLSPAQAALLSAAFIG